MLIGAAFRSWGSLDVYREVHAITLPASPRGACEGPRTTQALLMGRPLESFVDGAYQLTCGDSIALTKEVQVVCGCR